MTHRELVTVPREFHPHETQFFSLFIKTLTCHQKCICDRLLNANETLVKLSLRLRLALVPYDSDARRQEATFGEERRYMTADGFYVIS
jgi:hypothetical protein